METIKKTEQLLAELPSELGSNYSKPKFLMPDRRVVIEIVKHLQCAFFPDFYKFGEAETAAEHLGCAYGLLKEQIRRAALFGNIDPDRAGTLTDEFFSRLPKIKSMLLKDIKALFDGDPAAKSYEEVIICYPGFYTITIFRIAHELYQMKIPLISRMMTEYAHEKTGIDIHAGATIGEYFFIDHGTGIVIGETTAIGDHVKLYQGVTLGARSFELDPHGNPVKGIKRHPNIGSNVVIYANATNIGRDTNIGDNCVIGAGVWLTSSVEKNKRVYYSSAVTVSITE
ncbi:MAG: serine acetyltransferase [Clostridia bacterium]|nr:serine acetyltransferase [Clostridia bacterium]